MKFDKLVDSKEAAEILGLTNHKTLHVWASNKRYDLPIVKIGRLLRYKMSDIAEFIAKRRLTQEKAEEFADATPPMQTMIKADRRHASSLRIKEEAQSFMKFNKENVSHNRDKTKHLKRIKKGA